MIFKESFRDRYVYAELGTTLVLGPTVKTVAEAGQPEMHAMDEEDLRSCQSALSAASGCCGGAHSGSRPRAAPA